MFAIVFTLMIERCWLGWDTWDTSSMLSSWVEHRDMRLTNPTSSKTKLNLTSLQTAEFLQVLILLNFFYFPPPYMCLLRTHAYVFTCICACMFSCQECAHPWELLVGQIRLARRRHQHIPALVIEKRIKKLSHSDRFKQTNAIYNVAE